MSKLYNVGRGYYVLVFSENEAFEAYLKYPIEKCF